jgi:DNA primase
MHNNYNKEDIINSLNFEKAILSLIPNAEHRKAILSPLREEQTASFAVDFETGKWNDFGSDKQGDIIELVKEIKGLDFKESLRYLNDYSNSQTPTNGMSHAASLKNDKPKYQMPGIDKKQMKEFHIPV